MSCATLQRSPPRHSQAEGLTTVKDYYINIFWSEDDEGYIADAPDLETCSAFGSTPEEALHEVQAAKAAWLEAAKSAGKPIPRPRYRPAIYRLAS